MAFCTGCGSELAPSAKFCRRCGERAGLLPSQAPAQPSSSADPVPRADVAASVEAGAPSIRGALASLGIEVSVSQLAVLALSTVAGMVTARSLPNLFPHLDPLIRVGAQLMGNRDKFNSSMMTALTFLTSFAVAFIASRMRRRS